MISQVPETGRQSWMIQGTRCGHKDPYEREAGESEKET